MVVINDLGEINDKRILYLVIIIRAEIHNVNVIRRNLIKSIEKKGNKDKGKE
jgi:hypothetical protein